jgi:hypothetical protein
MDDVVDDARFDAMLKNTEQWTLRVFGNLCDQMELTGREKKEFVFCKLMFSLIGIAVARSRYWIFGLGDGCFGVDDDVTPLDEATTFLLAHRLLPLAASENTEPTCAIYTSGILNGGGHLWVASDGMCPLLAKPEGRPVLRDFLKDECAAARDAEGNDLTIQAFRRTLYKQFSHTFEDDVAFALVRARKQAEVKSPTTIEGGSDGSTS